MRVIEIVFAAIYGLIVVSAEVCSPEQCLKGSSPSSLLVHDKHSGKYLTPGTFLAGTIFSPSDVSLINPSSPLNQSTLNVGNNLVVSPPPSPVIFKEKNYIDIDIDVGDDSGRGGSAYFPNGYYGLVEPGKALWGAIPDISQLKGGSGSNSIKSLGLASCDSPCASGGACALDGFKAVCQCKEGWRGEICDVCAKGFFGSECKACQGNCSICDDGLNGTGSCLGTATTPLRDCNCAHGSCTASGDCVCAAGYRTNLTSSAAKCSICAQGFFKDANDNCLACPLGCGSCSLRDGTPDTPTCISCLASLSLSTTDPAICVSSGTCDPGQYYDPTSLSYKSCSPACSTCTGPSTSECLSCASPRVNLGGNCVGFDASTGVCDSALSGLQGVFVVNNAKSKCDSCPAGCLSCTIPSFSSASAYSSASCRACQHGYLLENGKCVKTCSAGWFLPTGSTTNGTCQRCDSKCAACVGTATTCTMCSPPTFASGGSCVTLCPSNSVASNGTCMDCSPDCATCSTPSSSSCISCPSFRPVLRDGRCIEFCPKDQYFNTASSNCQKCDTSCGSCIGGSSMECSTCPIGFVLSSGQCIAQSCKHGEVTGLGICLEDLVVSKKESKYLGLIALFAVIGLLAFGGWCFIRRQRRQTREATQEFAETIDDKNVRDRMMVLRLESLLGLDRGKQDRQMPSLLEEGEKKEKERKRLRELLLVSRRKKERGVQGLSDKEVGERIPMVQRKSTIDVVDPNSEVEKGKGEIGGRVSHWFAPPPPYASSAGASSTSSLPSGKSSTEENTKWIPVRQSLILDCATPSPISTPRTERRGPLPPRRSSGTLTPFIPQRKVPLGQGESEGQEVDRRRSLKKLWPAMSSPTFGQRSGEGYV